MLGDSIEGEARDVGKVMAGIALQVALHGQPASGALRAAVGRRDHGHRARRRPRRAQRRVPAVARHRARRAARHLTPSPATPTASMARRKSPARIVAPDSAGARVGQGIRPRDSLARQRRPRIFRGARRCGRHRPDADQRQRLPRHPCDRGRRGPRRARLAGAARGGRDAAVVRVPGRTDVRDSVRIGNLRARRARNEQGPREGPPFVRSAKSNYFLVAAATCASSLSACLLLTDMRTRMSGGRTALP